MFLGPQSSSSFVDTQKPFQVTYGSGAVAGGIITDNIAVAGLQLPNHTFGVANRETVDFSSSQTAFDGIMGLAQSTLSEQKTLTPVESLAKAGLIQEAITSFKISRLADQKNDGEVTLRAHVAKSNPHWKMLEHQELLVIFHGPHAYISPSLYEIRESVPTWNYVTVHAYGRGKILPADTDKFVPGNFCHSFEHALIIDSALAQLLDHHGQASYRKNIGELFAHAAARGQFNACAGAGAGQLPPRRFGRARRPAKHCG